MKAKEIIGNCPRDQIEKQISQDIEIEITITDHDLSAQKQPTANCPKKKQILIGSDEQDTDEKPSQTIPITT